MSSLNHLEQGWWERGRRASCQEVNIRRWLIFNIRRGGGQDARKSILEGSKYATVHMVTNMVTSKYLIFNCQRKVKNI